MPLPPDFKAQIVGTPAGANGEPATSTARAQQLFEQMYNALPPEGRQWIDLAGRNPDLKIVISDTPNVNHLYSKGAVKTNTIINGFSCNNKHEICVAAGKSLPEAAVTLAHEAMHNSIRQIYNNNHSSPWKGYETHTADPRKTLLMEALRIDLERNGKNINTMRNDLHMHEAVYKGGDFSAEAIVRVAELEIQGDWTPELQQKYPALDRFRKEILHADLAAHAERKPLASIDVAQYRSGNPAAIGGQTIRPGDMTRLASEHFGLSPREAAQARQWMYSSPDGWNPSPAQLEFIMADAYMKGNVREGYELTPKQQAYIRSLRGFESHLPTGENLHPSYQIPAREPTPNKPTVGVGAPKATGSPNVAAAGRIGVNLGQGGYAMYQDIKAGDTVGLAIHGTQTGVGLTEAYVLRKVAVDAGKALSEAELAALKAGMNSADKAAFEAAKKAALKAAAAQGGKTAARFLPVVGWAVMAADGVYQVAKEDTAEHKAERAAGWGITTGAALGTASLTSAAATAAGITIGGGAVATVGAIALPALAAAGIAVGIGYEVDSVIGTRRIYAEQDQQFAATQTNKHIDAAIWRIYGGGTKEQNDAVRNELAAKGAKFIEHDRVNKQGQHVKEWQLDMLDAGTRQVVREELEKKKEELRPKAEYWGISPRYRLWSIATGRTDEYNSAKSDLAIMDAATTELDNYEQNYNNLKAKQFAGQARNLATVKGLSGNEAENFVQQRLNYAKTQDKRNWQEAIDGLVDETKQAHEANIKALNDTLGRIPAVAARDEKGNIIRDAKGNPQLLVNEDSYALKYGEKSIVDGKECYKFDRKCLEEMNKDVAALTKLTQNGRHPQLAAMRDGLAKLSGEMDQRLKQEEAKQQEQERMTQQQPVSPPAPASPVMPPVAAPPADKPPATPPATTPPVKIEGVALAKDPDYENTYRLTTKINGELVTLRGKVKDGKFTAERIAKGENPKATEWRDAKSRYTAIVVDPIVLDIKESGGKLIVEQAEINRLQDIKGLKERIAAIGNDGAATNSKPGEDKGKDKTTPPEKSGFQQFLEGLEQIPIIGPMVKLISSMVAAIGGGIAGLFGGGNKPNQPPVNPTLRNGASPGLQQDMQGQLYPMSPGMSGAVMGAAMGAMRGTGMGYVPPPPINPRVPTVDMRIMSQLGLDLRNAKMTGNAKYFDRAAGILELASGGDSQKLAVAQAVREIGRSGESIGDKREAMKALLSAENMGNLGKMVVARNSTALNPHIGKAEQQHDMVDSMFANGIRALQQAQAPRVENAGQDAHHALSRARVTPRGAAKAGNIAGDDHAAAAAHAAAETLGINNGSGSRQVSFKMDASPAVVAPQTISTNNSAGRNV